MGSQLDISALAERLRKVRQERSKTLRDVFDETGISIPTLSRIERGDAREIESNTLFALTNWMKVSSEIFNPDSKAVSKTKSTPDVVELHLRADKNLDPQTATLLSKMFRATYEQVLNKKG